MSEWSFAAAVLIIAGALMEAGGFLLVLTDLGEAERIMRRHEGDKRVYPLSARGYGDAHGALTDATGPAPTVEERVATLEERVAALSKQVDAARSDLLREIHTAVDVAVQQAGSVADEEVRRLAAVVAGVSVGGRRRTAIALFLIGLALASLGSLLSLGA